MRPLLLTAAALLLAPATRAQGVPPAGSTIASGGGPGGDIGEAIAVGSLRSETVVVGTFEQTATFGGVSVTSADAPAARSDAFVVKYGETGVALWARRMGTGVFNDFGAGVALESRGFSDGGNVYVSGYFTGIATFDGGTNPTLELTTRNDFDAFLAAYSGDGDLLWVEQAGGPDQDTGRGVAVDPSGHVYWTGSFTGTATWGAGTAAQTRTSAGSSDGFLARYLPDGTLDQLLTVGGSEGDDLRAVALPTLFSTDIVATGTFRGVARFGTTPLQSRGLSDVAVVKVGDTGNVVWAQQIGGSGNDYARGVAVSLTGRVGVAGSFENDILVGQDVLTSAGFSDAFLAVLTENGAPIAGFRGGGAGFDIATGVAATPYVDLPVQRSGLPADQLFAVTGYIDGASTFGQTAVAAQGTDAFAALYGDPAPAAPDQLEVLRIGGTNSDRGAAVAIGGFPQTLALTGNFRGQLPFAGSTVVSAGGNDVYIARVPLCPAYYCFSGVDGEAGPEAGTAVLSVSPNPSRRPVVTLHLAAPAEATVEVIDALGRVVAVLHRGALPAGETRLATGALVPGTYVARARGAGVAVKQAFVVVR